MSLTIKTSLPKLVFLYLICLLMHSSESSFAPIAILLQEVSSDSHQKNTVFAIAKESDLSTANFGNWTTAKNQKASWQASIKSKASSLNFGFDKFHLPTSATLDFYDEKNRLLLSLDESDNKKHGQFWTPILPTNNILLQLNIDEHQMAELEMHISSINQGINKLADRLGANDDCMIDVLCGQADDLALVDEYRDIIQSVGLSSIDGTRICSGVLINNTANDRTPYFLTARHCGINASNAASVVVHWNFQNSYCRYNESNNGEPGDGSLIVFNSGAELVAEYQQSDMILLRLNDPVVADADAFFAGWDARESAPSNTVCIHHASTQEKRISFDFDQTSITRHFGEEEVDTENHIRVIDYDLGSTASGSSGAPLFNSDKKVVGQLHGGLASCGNDESDWFGRFYTSWTGDNRPDRQLMPWLDPLNTNEDSIEGLWDNPKVQIEITATQEDDILCAGDQTASIIIEATGGEEPYQYSINNGTSFSSSSQFQDLSAGPYELLVEDANGVRSETFIFTIAEPSPLVLETQLLYNQISLRGTGGVEPYMYSLDGKDFNAVQSYSVLSTGTYTYYVKDGNGCISETILDIEIEPFLAEAEVLVPLLCFNSLGLIELSVNSGGFPPFLYSLDGIQYFESNEFDGLTAGSYTGYIQDALGNISTTEPIDLTQEGEEIVLDVELFADSIIIDATGGVGGFTYSLNGYDFIDSNTFSNLPTGEYVVYVMDSNGCLAQTEVFMLTSIKDANPSELVFEIYPNPSSGLLNIDLGQNSESVDRVFIYTIQGMLIYEQGLQESNKALDVSFLENGIYWCRLSTKSKKTSSLKTFLVKK